MPTKTTSKWFLISFQSVALGRHSPGHPPNTRNTLLNFDILPRANYQAYLMDYDEPPTKELVKQWFPTIGYGGLIEANGTLKKSFLPPRWRLLMAQIIQCLGGKTGRKKSGTAKDTNLSQPPASTSMVTGMHKEVQQATSGQAFLRVTGKGGANPQLSSVKSSSHSKHVFSAFTIVHFESASGHDASADSTAEADLGKSALKDSLSQQQETVYTKTRTKKEAIYDQEFNTSPELTNSDDVTKEIKLEDMSKLVKDVTVDTIELDSLEDDQPFMVEDDEEEEVHVEPHTKTKDALVLPPQKTNAEAEVALLSAQPSFPNVEQLTELLVKSLKPELSKLLTTYDFSSSIPTELKELSYIYEVLGEDILKITILTPNTSYPSRKIRRIRACTHQRPQRKQAQYAVFKEDQYANYWVWFRDEVPPKSKNDTPLRDKNLEGVDLLKGNRTTNLYSINLDEMASTSPICIMARATSTKSWLWHQSKKASHPPKPVPNSKQRLHLLHMDLCGPMRVESINDKRYVLVIVDEYSHYTWVHFLKSKDEAPEEIKTFLKKITVLLQASVIIVRTDNGTEFKNQVLKEYFDSVGISHQASSVRTPQQNGVMERRNRTLVEAARTMLIFSHAPLFLWDEAVTTACYTHTAPLLSTFQQ
ncbi:retrovirus-related pol polyprotein from transposon TNT 1-94 [Tanacetum coccineum]